MKNIFWGIILLVTLFSCSLKKQDIIPQRKMPPIIVDIHIANGIMSTNQLFNLEYELDSIKIYSWVFDKHGITKKQFDSSLVYYTRQPDALNKIYDKVIARLSKIQDEISSAEEKEATEKTNIVWQDKKTYRFPADGPTDKLPLDVPITKPGTYTISAKIQIRKIDQSLNPRITAYFWYDDGSDAGRKEYFGTVMLKKDNEIRIYSCSKKINSEKFTRIKGYILNHDNTNPNFVKHAIVSDLMITFQK
jgi:hypothetical protein